MKNNKNYRILVHGMAGGHGGIETFIMNVFRNLNDNKTIHMDFLCNELNPYEDEITNAGSKIFYIPSKTKNPVKYKLALKKFFKKYAISYDCLWDNESSLANVDYIKLAKKYNIKRRIIHSHTTNNVFNGIKKPIVDFLQKEHKKNIDQIATDFWACSLDAAKWMFPINVIENTKVINNGIDTKKMKFDGNQRKAIRNKLHLDNEKYIIGTVGRISLEKNQSFFLDVMHELVKSNKQFRFVLVGDGPIRNELEQKIKKMNLQNFVILAGLQTNTQAWYSSFDCFVLPSKFEGLSVSGLEAQANGLPVLVSTGAHPNDLKINSDNFVSLDLNKGAKAWANEIIYMSKKMHRCAEKNINENFKLQKMDILSTSNVIKNYLLIDDKAK